MTAEEIRRLLTKDENGLLPCERCAKGKPNIRFEIISPPLEGDHKNSLWDITCWNCGLDSSGYDSEETAKEAWNQRASTPAILSLLAVIERQREALEPIGRECELMAYTSAGDPERMENMQWFAKTAGIIQKALASSAEYAALARLQLNGKEET